MKFKPEDFEGSGYGAAADIANGLFDKWLSEQRRVYGKNFAEGYKFISGWSWGYEHKDDFDTHQALLINVTEIHKECEHENPTVSTMAPYYYIAECSKCGVTLKPTGWEES